MILEKNKLIVPNKDITYFLAPDYIYVPASKILKIMIMFIKIK